MKKITAIFLVLIMVMIAGCAGESGGTSGTVSGGTSLAQSTASSVGAPEPAGTGEPKFIDDTSISGTVRFWIPFKGDQGMDDMIAEFNTVYPNIKVDLTPYNNNTDGNAGVNTAMLAGEIDVLASFGLNSTYKRWEAAMYEDLTEVIAADNIDLISNWGSDKYKYNGRVYTLPCGGLSNYISINMTAWEEAKLGNLPVGDWTWDEYLEVSKAMTKDGVFGGSDYHSVDYCTYPMKQVIGHDAYYNDDGTCSADNPLFLKALKREIKAEQEDKIWLPLTRYRSDNLSGSTTYLTGMVASGVNVNITRFLRDTENYPVDWVTYFAPYPVEEKGQPNYMEGVAIFSHAGIASNANKANHDAAYAFLKWYATEGSKYLTMAGHMPTWTGTNLDGIVELIFGSEAEAAKLIDVESFKRVVCNFSGLTYVETELTAYSEVTTLMNEYIMYAHNGEMSPEDALAELKKEADAAIAKG